VRSEKQPVAPQRRCGPTIPDHSPFTIRRLSPTTARCSPLAARRFPPFAIRGFSPMLPRPRKWVSHERPLRAPSPPGRGGGEGERREKREVREEKSAVGAQRSALTGFVPVATWAGLGPAPTSTSTIRNSPFAIRHSPFFSARHSLLAVFHHSLFAIRYSRFLTDPRWPTEMGVQQRMRGCPRNGGPGLESSPTASPCRGRAG